MLGQAGRSVSKVRGQQLQAVAVELVSFSVHVFFCADTMHQKWNLQHVLQQVTAADSYTGASYGCPGLWCASGETHEAANVHDVVANLSRTTTDAGKQHRRNNAVALRFTLCT